MEHNRRIRECAKNINSSEERIRVAKKKMERAI
jgi:hypothetical protein